MARMSLRNLIPNSLVNYGKHLPLAVISQLTSGFPARGMKIIGVTGTDGKTTTVNMIYRVIKDAGKKVAMISTVGVIIDGSDYGLGFHVTSPSTRDLVKYIKMAKKAGSEYLVLEVSSHALDQFRVWGLKFDIGVITNITHEHLDYHKNWENYFLAKSKLIKNSRIAVINRDEKHFNRLKNLAAGSVVSFGMSGKADFNSKKFPVNLKVPGAFNVLNAETAAAVGVNLGFDRQLIKNSLNNFQGVKGRMNEFHTKNGVRVVVDFAHTPNGLENAMATLKGMKHKKIIAVFGSAGKRDVSKRELMGEVAAKNADILIITAEDPRGELVSINDQIMKGVSEILGSRCENVYVINDRKEAIKKAITELATSGDIVGIFGKGHEESMNLDGKHEIAWSDIETVKELL